MPPGPPGLYSPSQRLSSWVTPDCGNLTKLKSYTPMGSVSPLCLCSQFHIPSWCYFSLFYMFLKVCSVFITCPLWLQLISSLFVCSSTSTGQESDRLIADSDKYVSSGKKEERREGGGEEGQEEGSEQEGEGKKEEEPGGVTKIMQKSADSTNPLSFWCKCCFRGHRSLKGTVELCTSKSEF